MILWRAHGLGNDYLVLEQGPALSPTLARAICDRHHGVGADGILEPQDTDQADYGVRIWNPDGSVAEKSGNGLRIFARWLAACRSAGNAFSIWTGTDPVTVEVGQTDISISMGEATVIPERVPVLAEAPLRDAPVQVGGTALRITAIGLGNPHCVIYVDGALDAVDWRTWGRLLETHPLFPRRTNVQVARVIDATSVEARIWERGAGETLASGSSACAVVAAGVETGRLTSGEISVHMPGGTLRVVLDADRHCTLIGPVEIVGRFHVDPRWMAQRASESTSLGNRPF